jgi:rare lipoprotein A
MVSRRVNAYAVLMLACGALALPAGAWASSGGSGLAPSGPTQSSGSSSQSSGSSANTGSNTGASVQTTNGNATVSTTGNGITVQARSSTMLRKGLTFSGTAPASDVGDQIEIQRSGHQTNWSWAPTVTATVNPGGTFQAVWHTNHIGRFAVRALVASSSLAQAATATPSMTVTVFLSSVASWYGGRGENGRRTACGEKLTATTIGVANKTLKCGTKVALYYDGRTMIVPVIDRGPYVKGRSWDLTQATAEALDFDGVATIGAVSLPQP